MLYFFAKALHIIFVVTWFAGLFYMVRLFVYHAELQHKPEEANVLKHLKIWQKKLWYAIAWPSMIITLVLGIYLAQTMLFWQQPWLLVKLGFVLLLLIYHGICHYHFVQFAQDKNQKSHYFFRYWNETATILLFVIVFLVVFKGFLNVYWSLLGFGLFSALLFYMVYKINRK